VIRKRPGPRLDLLLARLHLAGSGRSEVSGVPLKGRSIAATLFGLSAVWLVVALAATAFLLSGLFSDALDRRLTDQLNFDLQTLIGQTITSDGVQTSDLSLSDPGFSRPATGWYWQVRDAKGAVVNYSSSLLGALLPEIKTPFGSDNTRSAVLIDPYGTRIRAVERRFTSSNHTLRILVTGNLDEIDKQVSDFRGQALIVLGAVAVMLAAMSFIVARVALRPVGRLRRAVEAVREGEAGSIEGTFPRELAPLADEVNDLLRSNAQIIERARSQVGNLAHGLKTPLAVLRNEASATKSPLSSIVLGETDKMAGLVSTYLDRARLSARTSVIGKRADARLVLGRLARVMEKLHENRTVALEVDGAPWFRGDEGDLEEMSGNLIDNACKWSKSVVKVTAAQGDGDSSGQIVICVEDDGPGLSEEDAAKVLRRGVRLDEKTPGSGLGLDIVKELVDVYGGSLDLDRSPLGGLRARLALPAARSSGT
jgi:signal transduction histidine kinase